MPNKGKTMATLITVDFKTRERTATILNRNDPTKTGMIDVIDAVKEHRQRVEAAFEYLDEGMTVKEIRAYLAETQPSSDDAVIIDAILPVEVADELHAIGPNELAYLLNEGDTHNGFVLFEACVSQRTAVKMLGAAQKSGIPVESGDPSIRERFANSLKISPLA
jgi:hypothetical protein